MSGAIQLSEQVLAITEGWMPRHAVELVRQQIAPDLSDGELALFLADARARGLDPMRKQIYAVVRQKRRDGRVVGHTVTHQVGIDGFWAIAQRTGQCAGEELPQWCGADGTWRDVWLDPAHPPAAARAIVYRLDAGGTPRAYSGLALWESFAQRDSRGNYTGLWSTMGPHMLLKCATALALRKAFPEELGGLYTPEEMDQSVSPAPAAAPAPRGDVVEGEVVADPPKRGLDKFGPPAAAPRPSSAPAPRASTPPPAASPPAVGPKQGDPAGFYRLDEWCDVYGIAGGEGVVYSGFEELSAAYSKLADRWRVPSGGKYAGRELVDLPSGYIEWLVSKREAEILDPEKRQYVEFNRRQLAALELVQGIHHTAPAKEGAPADPANGGNEDIDFGPE